MTILPAKTDKEIENFIRNYEQKGATALPFYHELLEERARRSQLKHKLNIDKSLALLRQAAIEQRCITYGDLAKASDVAWSQAHRLISGANGHLDRLLDVCHARGLPMLTALCVNQSGLKTGELEEYSLAGFAAGARRLGIPVFDELAFHHASRDASWRWGREQSQ